MPFITQLFAERRRPDLIEMVTSSTKIPTSTQAIFLFMIFVGVNLYLIADMFLPSRLRPTFLRGNRKDHIVLAVGILTKLTGKNRRDAIRDTWFHVCRNQRSNVSCRFFTDSLKTSDENHTIYIKEGLTNGDIEFVELPGSQNFALMLVKMFEWFTERYDFDFFLRTDDDYFVCLDRLLWELPHRPDGIYWGWVHCTHPLQVYVDEGFMILSKDIVAETLRLLPTSLLCHPYGDQAVALWIKNSKLKITTFMDNERLVHEVSSYKGDTYLVNDLCHRYIGLHGTYPEYMYKYWNLYNSSLYTLKQQYYIPSIEPLNKTCQWNAFSLDSFGKPYYAEPELCKDEPLFIDHINTFTSREIMERPTS